MRLHPKKLIPHAEIHDSPLSSSISVEENDRYRRYITSFTCTIISIFFFVGMALLNIAQGHERLAAILLACVAVCFVCIFMQMRTGDQHLPSLLLCSTHIILTWFMFTIGSFNLWSLMWTFAYPHAFMLWLGLTEGTAMSVFFISSMVVLSSPPVQHMLPVAHETEAVVLYTVVLIGSFVFAFSSEFLRDKVQKKLTLLTLQMEKMALTDPLTGLGNRLAFEQHLKREYARFLRFSDSFSLIMGDIDYFKNINDEKGHTVGDAVLQHTAELMQGRLRPQDGIFRWGGEEFVIALSGLSPDETDGVAEKLRLAIAETPCPYQNDSIHYTMSFGAHYCSRGESPEQAMEKVDALLYAAKRTGRNRIVSDGSAV